MFALDPAARPTIEEILGHPWMLGDVPTYDEIVSEFTNRISKSCFKPISKTTSTYEN